MGRESLIPLVEEIEEFNGRWKEALGESSKIGNAKSDSINRSRGIFEPGAIDRVEKLAKQMANQVDEMTGKTTRRTSQQDEMARRKQIMKARLGGQRTAVQRDEGFEPGE